jgi:hypothetical protein
LVLLALLGLAIPAPAHAGEPIRPDLWVTDNVVVATVVSGNSLYIGGGFTQVGPNTGSGVPLAGDTGLALGTFPVVSGRVAAVVPDGSGGWYIGGDFHQVGGLARNRVAHILPDYSVDPAWDPNADIEVSALALSPDGKTVYAGGYFSNIGGQLRGNLAALDAATGHATAWNPAPWNVVRGLAVSKDGSTVYVGGDFDSIGGKGRYHIAALDAATGKATGWNPDAQSTVQTLALSGDGKTVYAGGYFYEIGGQPRRFIAALDATTGNATSWNPSAGDAVFTLVLNGATAYAGGRFDSLGGVTRNNLAAIDLTTGRPTGWDPDPNLPVQALVVSGDGGTVYAGGDFRQIGGANRHNIAALDVTTGKATAWDPSASGQVTALALSGNTLYAGGEFGSINMVARNHIAALDLTTGQPTAWDPNANDDVNAVALHNGTVYAGGSFTQIGGQNRARIAALDGAGKATDWNPNADGGVDTLAVSGDGKTVYVGGWYTNIGGAARKHIAALDTSTGAATTWNPSANGAVGALALSTDEDTVYAGGLFGSIGGQTRKHIAALDATTGKATAWAPNASDDVYVLAVSDGTVYAGGEFGNIGGQTRNRIAALDAGTGAATTWNPSANNNVWALALTTDGGTIYAGGEFTRIGGQTRNRIAALDAATGKAAAWNPDANSRVLALALHGQRLYAGGWFWAVGGQNAPSLAGILLTGRIIIEKETAPAGGSGFRFSQDIDGTGDFSLDDGQSKTFFDILPGQYKITEADPSITPGRYDLTNLVCKDSYPQGETSTTGVHDRTATVNLESGETVVCTFTNQKWGKIIVAKETEPGGQPDAFTFSGAMTANLEDGESKSRWVRPGTYTVQETVPKGWELTDITCSNKESFGDVRIATATYRVAPGEDVTCTFTNSVRATITVKKLTHPAGAGQAFAFTGAISAQLKDTESASKVVEPGTYTVQETVPESWDLYLVICDDTGSTGDPATATATFRVEGGEHVTCTFANAHEDVDDLPATMVVAKETVPDGDPARFTFRGDAAGTIGDNQRIIVTGLEPGTYTSRELVPEGWRLAGIHCDDGESSGDLETATAAFRLGAGEVVTCTFTDAWGYGVYLPLVFK